MAAGSMAKATIHEPVGSKDLWHHKGWQLPAYIQHVANDLREKGRDESSAIRLAVGVVRNWAEGHDGKGHRVSATTQAAAAKAMTEWEALKARAAASHNLTASPVMTVDLAEPRPGQRYRHGWVPIAGVAGLTVEEHKKPGASVAVAHTVRLHDEVIGHLRPSGDRLTAHRRTGDAKDMRKMSGGFKSVDAAAKWVHASKANPPVPFSPNASGGTIDRVEAAARMFGRGSKQHKAAAKKFGVSLTAAPAATVDLAFTEALHPRGAKGSATGGKFVAKNSGGSAPPSNVAANVRDFQRRNKLPVTGVIDKATAAAITAARTAKTGSGKTGKAKARKAVAAAKRAAKARTKAAKANLVTHVATVNTMTGPQRAAARAAHPIPPTGYVWSPNNQLVRYP